MFEWDEEKGLANIRKHGVTFDDAVFIFSDSYRPERPDDDKGEGRRQTIGQAEGVPLFVVYTWRGDAIRIISARVAGSSERRIYYGDSETPPYGWDRIVP